ncbi:MAG: CapA family protein [Chloroflexia bacterium]
MWKRSVLFPILILLLVSAGCAPGPVPPAVVRPGETAPAAPARPTDPEPTPLPLTVAVESGAAPQGLGKILLRSLAEQGHPCREVQGRPADLYIGYTPPPDFQARPFTSTLFVPAVSFWSPVSEVAYADLERLFRREVENWAELGQPLSATVVPFTLGEPPFPLEVSGTQALSDTAALLSALETHPGGIALLPLEEVDVGLRVLRVDGRDLLLEEESVPGSPLVRTLFLAWRPTLPQEVVELLWALERPAASPPPPFTVAVVGDIFTGRAVRRRIQAHGGDYARPFTPTRALLEGADLTVANLEGVLSDRIAPPADPYTFLFVGSGRFTVGLRYAGIDAVSLANNHSMNFGPRGMDDTLNLLRQAGIAPFGAGMNLAEARRPALFTVKGVTLAFLGYDAISDAYLAGEERAGSAPADPALIAEDIAAARQQADVVIVYFHWGWEYTHDPSPWQRTLAHQAVEAGADLVLGSHPHWVQGLERYRGVPILYSLGNFIADQMWSIETRQGLIARITFRGTRPVGLQLQAVQIEDYHQPRPLPAAEAETVYRAIRQASICWPATCP